MDIVKDVGDVTYAVASPLPKMTPDAVLDRPLVLELTYISTEYVSFFLSFFFFLARRYATLHSLSLLFAFTHSYSLLHSYTLTLHTHSSSSLSNTNANQLHTNALQLLRILDRPHRDRGRRFLLRRLSRRAPAAPVQARSV